MTKPSLLELPAGVQLVYLAEGGANVIYRFVAAPAKSRVPVKKDPKRALSPVTIDPLDHGGLPARLTGKLLRLRKETAADLSYTEIVHNFNTIVRPLFKPEELVDQTLIRLPEGLLQRCNEQLRIAERNGTRPKKRHGGYLCPKEPFGLLITDMTTTNDPGATLAELKPKWLTQSPSAPSTAHRCRTCALREMKNHDARSLGLREQRSFCPLDLVSERFENVRRAADFIRDCHNPTRLAQILFRNPTLQNLQSQQKSWGKVGLYGPPALSQKASLDMTLRDCTMFIKVCPRTLNLSLGPFADTNIAQIPHDERSPVEIRLGDLDLKTGAGGKAQYWRDLELQLINGGWYRGSNSSQDPSECALQYPRDMKTTRHE